MDAGLCVIAGDNEVFEDDHDQIVPDVSRRFATVKREAVQTNCRFTNTLPVSSTGRVGFKEVKV